MREGIIIYRTKTSPKNPKQHFPNNPVYVSITVRYSELSSVSRAKYTTQHNTRTFNGFNTSCIVSPCEIHKGTSEFLLVVQQTY